MLLLEELKEQARKLSVSDRLELLNEIVESLQETLAPQSVQRVNSIEPNRSTFRPRRRRG